MARWLLPEGISDVLPHEARRLETLRRALLDLYHVHGYELVTPPLIEYLESLLTGVGADLDLRTFKLVDQLSGRMLGLRADTTPQVARIDAHILNRPGVARLCYAGPVLHARAAHPLAVREPLQVGAEVYGFSGLAADREIQLLAVATLRTVGAQRVQLDFGHVRVVHALLASLPAAAAEDALSALSIKDGAAIEALARQAPTTLAVALRALPKLHGGRDVLDEAARVLSSFDGVASALDELRQLADACNADQVSFDLADLHGYRYYTGVNFAAYVDAQPAAVLRGGRYDDIGRAFGRPRPATGFSIDLRTLAGRADTGTVGEDVYLAPTAADDALEQSIRQWRAGGIMVVRELGESTAEWPFHTHRIERHQGRWLATPVKTD